MSSHDHHDLARLAELAASDPRGQEARAMVAECPECAEEFGLQMEALDYLGELTTSELSEDERSGLRDGIWSRLQDESEERTTPATTPMTPLTPRRSWYPKVVGAAAALVIVVGLGYVLTDGVMSGSGDAASPNAAVSADEDRGEAATRAAAEQSTSAETTAAAGSTDTMAAAESAEDALGTPDVGVAGSDTAANTTVTARGDTTTAVAPTEARPGIDLDGDVAAAVSETVDRLRNSASARSTEDLHLTTDEEACVAELGIDRILTVDSITAGDTRLTVVSRRGDPDVVVFNPTNCQQVPGIGE